MTNENQVIAFGPFDESSINPAEYMNTLAAEALRTGLYTEADVEKIRLGLMNTLASVIGYHSGGESASVRTDTAKEFLGCIQYNCDTYLKSLGDHRKAAEMLKDVNTEELYSRGYIINKKIAEECRRVFENVKYTRRSDAPESCLRAIDVRIPHYLDAYDPRFNAQDKLYVSISAYKIAGPFHIDGVLSMLQKLLEINKGKESDIIL